MPNFNSIGSGGFGAPGGLNRYLPLTGGIAHTTVYDRCTGNFTMTMVVMTMTMMQAQCTVTRLTDDGCQMTAGCRDRKKCPHTPQSCHQLTTGMHIFMLHRPAKRL